MARTSVYVVMGMSAGARRDQKRAPDPLELELLAVVSHLVRVLGIELRSFATAIFTVNLSPLSRSRLHRVYVVCVCANMFTLKYMCRGQKHVKCLLQTSSTLLF